MYICFVLGPDVHNACVLHLSVYMFCSWTWCSLCMCFTSFRLHALFLDLMFIMHVFYIFPFIFRGFPTRMVYLYYISCLRYTFLVGNPRFVQRSWAGATWKRSIEKNCYHHYLYYVLETLTFQRLIEFTLWYPCYKWVHKHLRHWRSLHNGLFKNLGDTDISETEGFCTIKFLCYDMETLTFETLKGFTLIF